MTTNYIEIYDEKKCRNLRKRATRFFAELVFVGVAVAVVCVLLVALVALDKLSPWLGWFVCGLLTLVYLWYFAVRISDKPLYTARYDFVKQLPMADRVKRRATFVSFCDEKNADVFGFSATTLVFDDGEYLLDGNVECPFATGKTYDVVTVGSLVVAYAEVRNG